jgi:hypothetical protein
MNEVTIRTRLYEIRAIDSLWVMTVHVRQIGGVARVVIEATRELRERIESAHDSRGHH